MIKLYIVTLLLFQYDSHRSHLILTLSEKTKKKSTGPSPGGGGGVNHKPPSPSLPTTNFMTNLSKKSIIIDYNRL